MPLASFFETTTMTRLCLLIVSALALSGCSFLVNTQECETDADCASFQTADTSYTCDPEALVCTETPRGDTSPDPSDASPDTPGDTPADVPATDVSTDTTAGCQTNRECIVSNGEGSLCGADGECFSALSEDCSKLTMPANGETEKIVVVGSLLPLSEPFGSAIGQPLENAMQFATKRFNGEGGLPGGGAIAWLSCDSKGNAQIAKRAAQHMTQNVGVPAIIGPAFSDSFIAVAADTAQPPNEAILFATTPTSPAITNLHSKPDDLVWRNISSDRFQGKAFVDRVLALGAQRVLILHKDDKYGEDLRTEIVPPLLRALGTSNVKVGPYPNPLTIPDGTERRSEYGRIISQELTDFEPQVTLILGTSEGAEIAGAYFAVSNNLQRVPGKILMSHGVISVVTALANNLPKPVLPLIETIAPVIFELDDPKYQTFSFDYNIEFGGTESTLLTTTTFDAAMVVFLAMSTVPTIEDITPTSIARGIARLTDQGAEEIGIFEMGNFVSKARLALTNGDNINLNGISGPLDFDLATGSVYSRYYSWEIVEDEINGFKILPKRVYTFSNPPEIDGSWSEID